MALLQVGIITILTFKCLHSLGKSQTPNRRVSSKVTVAQSQGEKGDKDSNKRVQIKTTFILYNIERLSFSSLLGLQKLT